MGLNFPLRHNLYRCNVRLYRLHRWPRRVTPLPPLAAPQPLPPLEQLHQRRSAERPREVAVREARAHELRQRRAGDGTVPHGVGGHASTHGQPGVGGGAAIPVPELQDKRGGGEMRS